MRLAILAGLPLCATQNAATAATSLKAFLSDLPPVRDLAASFSAPHSTNDISRCCYVRWQNGHFVALDSEVNPAVLEGMTDQTGGLPSGGGQFGDYYWMLSGNKLGLSAPEWQRPFAEAPGRIRLRISALRRSTVCPLLTFGVNLVAPGSFRWHGNRAEFSSPEQRGKTAGEAELTVDTSGHPQKLRYWFPLRQHGGQLLRQRLDGAF